MNFVKRALLSIVRRKGKVLILFAVILILGNVISGAVSIRQASRNVESAIKEQLGAGTTIDLDYDKLYEMEEAGEITWEEIERIGTDLINQIGQLSYVKYYDYSMSNYYEAENLIGYDPYMEEYEDEEFMYQTYFHLKGINYPLVTDIEEGNATLIAGRVFNEEEITNGAMVTLVSTKVADLNNLSVGDTVTLSNVLYDYSVDSVSEYPVLEERDIPLEIIGIFETRAAKEQREGDDNEGSNNPDQEYFDQEFQNRLYVSNEVIKNEVNWEMQVMIENNDEYAELYQDEDNFEYYTPYFILNSVQDSEAFIEEATVLLPPLYHVISSLDQYEDIAGPIESISNLSNYVLIFAVVATILIISLVVLLFLRDRKRELGIYLSLGERKGRVIGQIMIEVAIVAIVAISVSLFTGNLLAENVSESLIEANTSTSDDFYGISYPTDFNSPLDTDDVIEAYEVTLSTEYIIVFYSIGLLTILVSTVVPLIYIVRLNPKKILM
ncbi:putative ABC transport system permease protein [Amphibacillus marinus]|uniref:Putative ABC transport system permease protein n=1 Tax=Amphibacillus marinus TaxID=872970 RepID=A0A1H8HLD2_9BACI|nr:ABC transporter permease [Amphibacillus marinus]SEN56864.1 putative ABC transport system permease protein [Amphibacillus marinus]